MLLNSLRNVSEMFWLHFHGFYRIMEEKEVVL